MNKFIQKYDNKGAGSTELNRHKEIIKEYTGKGYHYVGFILVKSGPGGKMLAI